MIDYQPLVERWENTAMAPWAESLLAGIARDFHQRRYGDLPKWLETLDQLPPITPSDIDLGASAIRIGRSSDTDAATRAQLEQGLRQLHPWRKGPFELFGIGIDTEWHSDWKWDRLSAVIDARAVVQSSWEVCVEAGRRAHDMSLRAAESYA